MAAGKRYFWLKLYDDFFDSLRIKKLRRIPGGDTYTIIYLKMLLIAMKHDGMLTFTGLEKDIVEELALDLNEDVDAVRMTLSYLLKSGLAETSDEVDIFLPFAVANTGSEGASAQRMRDLRSRKELSQCDKDVQHCALPVTDALQTGDGEIDIEIEKEIEIDIDNIYASKSQKKKSKSHDYSEEFEIFWKVYPKHKPSKDQSYKAFIKAVKLTDIDTIFRAVMDQKTSPEWTKDDGQYIPYATTWLNQHRWQMESNTAGSDYREAAGSRQEQMKQELYRACQEADDTGDIKWGGESDG